MDEKRLPVLGAEEAAAGLLPKRPRPPAGCVVCPPSRPPPSEGPEVAVVVAGVEVLLDAPKPLKRPLVVGLCLSPPLLKMLPGPPIVSLEAPAPVVLL